MSTLEIPTVYTVQGVDEVISAQRDIISAFRDGKISVDAFSEASKSNLDATRELNRAYNGLRMAQRVQNRELTDALYVMRGIGSVGNQLLNMWQAYSVGMIRVDSAASDLAQANQDLAYWTNLQNQYLRDFGPPSEEYLNAKAKVDALTKSQKDAQAAAEAANSSMNTFWISTGLSAAGAIAQIVQLILKIQSLSGIVAMGGLANTIEGATAAAYSGLIALGGGSAAAGAATIAGQVAPIVIPAVIAGITGAAATREYLEEGYPYQTMETIAGMETAAEQRQNQQALQTATQGYVSPGTVAPGLGRRETNAQSTAAKPANVTVNQTNYISKEVDATVAGNAAYQQFVRRVAVL